MHRKALLIAVTALVAAWVDVDAYAQTSRKSVSGSEVTGTFRRDFTGRFKGFSSEIRIAALGGGKLRVAFDLIYPVKPGKDAMANTGTASGEADIDADEAVYSSDEFGPCTITIKFVRPGTIKVTQEGTDTDCGFGHNVTADGTYRKVSSKKPTFDDQ